MAAEPEDWPFCHYGALIGLHPPDELVDEDEILGLLARDPKRARARLRDFVEDGDPRRRRQMFLRACSEEAQSAESTMKRPQGATGRRR